MEDQTKISKAHKRWIVREIQSGRMTTGEAKERIELYSKESTKRI